MRIRKTHWIVPALAAGIFLAPGAAPPARDLASLVKAYRESPGAARRAPVVSWAASHPKEGALARLALGIADFERGEYAASAASLEAAGPKLPQLADVAGWYAAQAYLELKDFAAAGKHASRVHAGTVASPFTGRAHAIEARALIRSDPAEALRLLEEHRSELTQPYGDLALGEALQVSGDYAGAVAAYQRVYVQYPSGDAAIQATAALLTLKDTLGDAFPQLTKEMRIKRGDRLVELRDYQKARAEFEAAGAKIRAAAVDIWRGQPRIALSQLRGLSAPNPDDEAERLYYIVEACRRLKEDDEMRRAVDELGRRRPASPWRLKALLAAADRFWRANQPDRYVPLFRAAAEKFPADPNAPFCNWRVAFASHMARERGAPQRMREHVQKYPWHSTAATALYFLGRRAEAEKDFAAAKAWYTRIAAVFPNQFYGVLARGKMAERSIASAGESEKTEEFLNKISFPPRKPPTVERTPATAARIERARLLRTAGLDDLAETDLRFGAKTDGQPWLLAIDLASHAESPYIGLRAMKSLVADYLNVQLENAPRKLWELLFPMPWRTELLANARDRGLDPWVLAGLIRQESEFNPKAVSRAKAYGLTQVRPPTGREYARRAGVPRVTVAVLTQPSANLKLGSTILKSMYDRQGGRWERALAAYNAGPGRVAEWSQWAEYREQVEFIESIPIQETREYVQSVLRNADIYRRLYARE